MSEILTPSGLLPCPFCGREAKIVQAVYGLTSRYPGKASFRSYCGSCGAGPQMSFPLEADAIDVWNRRAAPPQPQDEETI